jgi:predicted RNA-binding Zn ribbon-like protein
LPGVFVRRNLVAMRTASISVGVAARGDTQRSLVSPSAIPHTVSDHLCVDLVNSRFSDHLGSGVSYDRLLVPEWRCWFLLRCGLEPPDSVSQLTLRKLTRLRTLLRELMTSHRKPNISAIRELNDYLQDAPSFIEMSQRGGRLRQAPRWQCPPWSAAAAQVIGSYLDILEAGQVSQIRVCENPACSFVFIDESRNRRRRWCDATICGNLMHVRAHRSRSQN